MTPPVKNCQVAEFVFHFTKQSGHDAAFRGVVFVFFVEYFLVSLWLFLISTEFISVDSASLDVLQYILFMQGPVQKTGPFLQPAKWDKQITHCLQLTTRDTRRRSVNYQSGAGRDGERGAHHTKPE